MDLIGNYSDSDNENEINEQHNESNKNNNKASNVSNPNPLPQKSDKNKNEKKKRKLDISFLPEKIQAALVRGVDDSDSDSDSEQVSHQKLYTVSSTSSLLQQLPMPRYKSSTENGKIDIESVRKEYTQTFESVNEKFSEKGDVFDTIQPFVEKPTTQISYQNETSMPQPISYQSNEAHILGDKGKSNRRRDREIEQQLLQGNANAVEMSNYVDATNTAWNSSVYFDQQNRQKEMEAMFGYGQGKVAMPSRVQNKKHHINSLLLNAAQSELEMLDERAARMKSKSNVKSKYGW